MGVGEMGWGYSNTQQAGAEPHQMRAGPLGMGSALQRPGSSHTRGTQAMLCGIHPGFSMGTPRAGPGPPVRPQVLAGSRAPGLLSMASRPRSSPL